MTSAFGSILVPLDGSTFAEQALPLATRIAWSASSRLRLGLVHELSRVPLDLDDAQLFTSIELASRKAEREYLRAVQARLRGGGTRLSRAVTLTGSAGPALARYVREMGIDLVVMASHGRGGIRRAWLGSVADHLIRNLDVPVLLVRPATGGASLGSPTADQILVPLDGSPLAEEALGPAIALARIWGAQLMLLQVVRPVQLPANMALPYPSSYDEDLTAIRRTQAQDYLGDVVERLKEQGIRAACAAAVGWGAADAILDQARRGRVAFVVLATHGRGGLRRLALGSVADKVVRGAELPVLVCRPAGRGKARTPARRGGGSRSKRTAREVL